MIEIFPVVLLSLSLLLLSPLFANASTTSDVHLASVHAVVGELESGRLLHSKHQDTAVPIASVTKLMTAMVVLDAEQSLDEWIPILGWQQKTGKNGYSRIRVGSTSSRAQLLKIALMSSENLASHTLARHYPGGLSAFIEAMNDKATELGMTNSRFADPTGLSTANTASAADLWKMLKAAHGYDRIRAYTTTYQHHANFKKPRYSLGYGNTNPLTAPISSWNVQLSKTGYLKESGRCLVMVTDIDGKAVGMVFLNSLGSRSPLGDAGRTRRWLTTGDSGHVAKAARDYEQRTIRMLFEPSDD